MFFPNKFFLLSAFLALLLCGCHKSTTTADASSPQQNSEELAIKSLAKTVQSDSLYPDIRNEKCLTYEIEHRSANDYEIAIHENHVDGCGGDPHTAPVRDRFMVSQSGEVMQVYDSADDKYVAYQHSRLPVSAITQAAESSTPGASPLLQEVDQANRMPKRQWFTHDLNHANCMKSSSPADKIREFQEFGQIAKTNDLASGAVEVEVDIGNGRSQVWTFYRTPESCQATLPRSQNIDGKYE